MSLRRDPLLTTGRNNSVIQPIVFSYAYLQLNLCTLMQTAYNPVTQRLSQNSVWSGPLVHFLNEGLVDKEQDSTASAGAGPISCRTLHPAASSMGRRLSATAHPLQAGQEGGPKCFVVPGRLGCSQWTSCHVLSCRETHRHLYAAAGLCLLLAAQVGPYRLYAPKPKQMFLHFTVSALQRQLKHRQPLLDLMKMVGFPIFHKNAAYICIRCRLVGEVAVPHPARARAPLQLHILYVLNMLNICED